MSVKLKKITLKEKQPVYASHVLRQVKENGVALLQLPTGQGKTLITLKVVAELLRHSKKPRTVVLVTAKRLGSQDRDILENALRGEPQRNENCERNPWARDAFKTKGLAGLCKGKKPKLDSVWCWSARDINSGPPPAGSIVIIDEVHRFASFLQYCADNADKEKGGVKPSPSKRRQYILLSATPINPTRISEGEERAEITFEEQEKKEDKSICIGYLNLYKAMISLSSLSKRGKGKLLELLERSAAASLEDFAADLKTVMRRLKPVPSPKLLLKLGPKGKPPYQPATKKLRPETYHESINGLLKLHELVSKDSDLYYCAERMALAGAKASPGASTVGFWPLPKSRAFTGHAHYQPGAEYVEETLKALQIMHRREKPLRSLLSGKIDALFSFLRKVWQAELSGHKWRVLVYCAHQGSVSALAAELERRFVQSGITCKCGGNDTKLYGKNGASRVVWDTQRYSSSCENHPENELIRLFGEPQTVNYCDGNRRCPAGFVLVTSDRLSESISLHDRCEIMVHFDLDWSPLRMIQRFGRLWRINTIDGKNNNFIQRPQKPAVFHMVQPGSVDEEILWRLEKRWERLEALGLGLETVRRDDALGCRIY